MKEKVWFYREEIESWLHSLEAHRDGLKGRAWLLDKMLLEVREKIKRRKKEVKE